MLLDPLGYLHNDGTTPTCNKHNITVYRIPPNTTAWLQLCDVLVFGSAKQKVDIPPTLQRTCNRFVMHNSAVKRTWDRTG